MQANEKIRQAHRELYLMDYIALRRGTKPEGIYGYTLKDVCEKSGKLFNSGTSYRALGKLAGYGYLQGTGGKVKSDFGPAKRIYHTTDSGVAILAQAEPRIAQIQAGITPVTSEITAEAESQLLIGNVTLIDLQILSVANTQSEFHSYSLKEVYTTAGKSFFNGAVHRKLGVLASHGLICRESFKVSSGSKGPPRRMHQISQLGQQLLLESRPFLDEITTEIPAAPVQ